jgi:hypothetical protein
MPVETIRDVKKRLAAAFPEVAFTYETTDPMSPGQADQRKRKSAMPACVGCNGARPIHSFGK